MMGEAGVQPKWLREEGERRLFALLCEHHGLDRQAQRLRELLVVARVPRPQRRLVAQPPRQRQTGRAVRWQLLHARATHTALWS